MSSICKAEEQPLLNNTMSNGPNWDKPNSAYAEIHISDDRHNGLNRREKNSDCHASDDEVTINISLPPPQREERFPPEKLKTCLAFSFLAINMAWTLTILSIVHERMPDRQTYAPLPDVFFDIFPSVEWALDVSEFIIIASVWLTVVMIIFHKHRFIIFRRCFIIIGVLYFMRSLTMFVTQVPVASKTYFCSPKAESLTPSLVAWRVLYMMSGFGLSINGHHTFCGDYIYSGHTVILTMVYLVVREYSPRKLVVLHWLVLMSSFVGVFMVLLARGHYSVDVVIGYYVTSRVFWIYHTVANNPSLKTSGNQNFLSRVWWFPLFMYLEKNVNGVVPHKFEWPFPWPKKFCRHTRIS